MSGEIKNFLDLVVWQKALGLVELVYSVVRELPSDERYA